MNEEPALTEYEEKIFRIFFVNRHTPGYAFTSIQLEGDKRLPVVAAGLRLQKKGIVSRWQSCRWTLTDLGVKMAEARKAKK